MHNTYLHTYHEKGNRICQKREQSSWHNNYFNPPVENEIPTNQIIFYLYKLYRIKGR